MLGAVNLRAEVFIDEYDDGSVTLAGSGSGAANPYVGVEQ
jgi:hypothetical protein